MPFRWSGLSTDLHLVGFWPIEKFRLPRNRRLLLLEDSYTEKALL